MTDIQQDINNLDENVDFLFDETVIQDERLFQLETETEGIEEDVEGRTRTDRRLAISLAYPGWVRVQGSGVSTQGVVCLSRGMCLFRGGVCPGGCGWSEPSPPVLWTDRCL